MHMACYNKNYFNQDIRSESIYYNFPIIKYFKGNFLNFSHKCKGFKMTDFFVFL